MPDKSSTIKQMKKLISPALAAFVVVVLIVSCLETEQVSTVPEVTFKDFSIYVVYDSFQEAYLPVGLLEFEFIDGDANIGIYYDTDIDSDTTIPDIYKNNVFLMSYYKSGTNYLPICTDTTCPDTIYYKIFHDTKLDRTGQNKTIKGTIRVTISYEVIPPYDTLRYDFFIADRDMNFSNIESTTDISFNGLVLPD